MPPSRMGVTRLCMSGRLREGGRLTFNAKGKRFTCGNGLVSGMGYSALNLRHGHKKARLAATRGAYLSAICN